MRSSNKRSRHKNNNNRRGNQGGNIINRVFDSSGPEGKVRGTPQQIIEKYQALARDAQLSGDRIAHESFLQYAEHYLRILNRAQRELEERKEASQKHQAAQNQQNKNNSEVSGGGNQPDVPDASTEELFPGQENDSDLVQTPESKTASEQSKPASKPKKPRKPKPSASESMMPSFITEPLADPVAEPTEKSAKNKAAG